MSAHHAEFPIRMMARVLKVSASGYDAWRSRPASRRATADADLIRRIRTIHVTSRGSYGAPRAHAELKAGGMAFDKKRVARLVLDALDMALHSRRPDSVIHHSDKGSQGGFKRSSVRLMVRKLCQTTA